jgi:hypothetical protein
MQVQAGKHGTDGKQRLVVDLITQQRGTVQVKEDASSNVNAKRALTDASSRSSAF